MDEFMDDSDPEYERELKKYAALCLLSEGSKILVFALIFGYYGLLWEYAAALFVMITLRCNSGGLHCKHYISCLLVSFAVLAGAVMGGVHCPVPTPYSAVILLACAIAGYRLAPVVSRNRPAPDEALITRSRKNTLCFILAYCILICICPYNTYLNICTWTVMIHITQLTLAFLQRRNKYVSFS